MEEDLNKYRVRERVSHANDELIKEYVDLVNDFGGYVAGGCFKDELRGNRAKDIDIYFKTLEGFEEARHYIDGNSERFESVFNNENVFGYKDHEKDRMIELNQRDIGEPCEVVKIFDFTVVKVAMYKEDGVYKMVHHKDFFRHNNKKILVIEEEEDLNPLRTFNRLIKYVTYGYLPTAETKEKVVRRINGVTLANSKIYSDDEGEDYLWYMEEDDTGLNNNTNRGYPLNIEVSYTQRYMGDVLEDSYERVVNSSEDIRRIEDALYSDPLVESVIWRVIEEY